MALQPFRRLGQVDPNLQGVGLVRNIQDVRGQQTRNALLDLNLENAPEQFERQRAQADRLEAQEESRLAEEEREEMAFQVGVMNSLIKSGDIAGAAGFAERSPLDDENRIATLLRGTPEDIATASSEIGAIADQFSQESLSTTQAPSDVRSFEFFSNLSVEQQAAMLNFKRAGQIRKIAQVDHFVDSQGNATPLNTPEGQANLIDEVAAAAQLAGGKEAAVQTAQTEAIPSKVAAQAEAEQLRDAPAAIASAAAQMTAIDTTMEEVSKAIGITGPSTAGWGAFLRFIPSSDALELRTRIDTIKANLAFDKLQNMRNLSKTGGALGQVSERELNLLESAVVSLNQELDDDTLKENFGKIATHYRNAQFVLNKIIAVQEGRLSESDAQNDIDIVELNSAAAQETQQIPQGAIDLLRQRPELRDQFLEKFGRLPEGL